METHLTIPSLTTSDNGSLLTCRAVQADTGTSVTTTVKLRVEGEDKTQETQSLIFQLISESEKQASKFVDASVETASNNVASDNRGVIESLSLIDKIIIGVCVVLLLYVVIVIMTLIILMRRSERKNNKVVEKCTDKVDDLAENLELKVI